MYQFLLKDFKLLNLLYFLLVCTIFSLAQQGMLLQPIIAEHLFLYEFQSTPCQPVTPAGLSHISHAPPLTDLTDIASLTRNLLTYPHQSSSLG